MIRIRKRKTAVHRYARIGFSRINQLEKAALRTGERGIFRRNRFNGDDFLHRLFFLFQNILFLWMVRHTRSPLFSITDAAHGQRFGLQLQQLVINPFLRNKFLMPPALRQTAVFQNH